ncbi:hypothetical protein BH10PSE17_BH10PSE17_25850 [soil metagenome]
MALADPDSIGDCPLCGRPMHLATSNRHHLVPRSRGGRDTQYLHRICHAKLHATFTEKALAREFNSVEALLTNPEIAAFVEWVRTKPIDFVSTSRKSRQRQT